MTIKQKLAALNALAPVRVERRGTGEYVVHQNVEVIPKGRRGILGSPVGRGRTRQAAIADHREQLMDSEAVVLHAGFPNRRELRWADYLWVDA